MILLLFYFFIASLSQKNRLHPKPRPKSYDYFNDPPATTRYAYLSGYTGDDQDNHFFILSMTLGYSLLRVSPVYDRILMIPSEMKLEPDILVSLRKVWTHIIYRPYIQWPDGYLDTRARDVFLWFKLNAWSVVGWEKILWAGSDSFFRRDPASIFNFSTPCSIIDLYVYGMSHLGPVTNGDFFLFKPSLRDFAGMRELGILWSRNPSKYGHRLQTKGAAWIGPHDQGLITQYYDGDITTAPQWYQIEVPGNPKSMYGLNITSNLDPRVVSFHFPSLVKPWKKFCGQYTTAWVNTAHEAAKFVGAEVDWIKAGFPPTGNVDQNLRLVVPSKSIEAQKTRGDATILENEDGIDPRLLFPKTLFRRRMLCRVFLAIFFANLLLIGAVMRFYFKPDVVYQPLD